MSYSKISSILLYIVFGISILVVLFFYFGDVLINKTEYAAKVEKLETPAGMNDEFITNTPAVVDSSAADSVAVDGDSTEIEEAPMVVEEVSTPSEPERVNLTFIETLVYNRTDIALIWAYILLIIAAIFAVIFPIARMFTNPRMLVRSLIGLVVVAGVLIGAYALGSDASLSIIGYEGTDNSDPQVLKVIDMGLFSMYFILGFALLAILYSEVAKYFK